MLLLLQQRVKIRKPLFWNSPHFPWEVTQEGDTTMCWSNLCASDKIQMSFLLRRNAKWKSTSCIFSSMPFSAPRPQESKLESRSESCFHWTNKSQKVRRSWLFLKILLTLASKTFVALWQLLMPDGYIKKMPPDFYTEAHFILDDQVFSKITFKA